MPRSTETHPLFWRFVILEIEIHFSFLLFYFSCWILGLEGSYNSHGRARGGWWVVYVSIGIIIGVIILSEYCPVVSSSSRYYEDCSLGNWHHFFEYCYYEEMQEKRYMPVPVDLGWFFFLAWVNVRCV